MERKTVKGLIAATAIAAIALTGGIAGSFAYFTRTVKGVAHIKVGNINMEFIRDNLLSHQLDSTGHLVDEEDGDDLDLTTDGSNAMDVAYAAPGAYYVATFKVTNTGKVAFTLEADLMEFGVKAYVETPTESETDPTADQRAELVNNTKIIVDLGRSDAATHTCSEFVDSTTVVNHKFVDGDSNNVVINAGASFSFDLKVILDEAMGNDAQNLKLDFAIRLTASQVVE